MVDDDALIRDTVEDLLDSAGYESAVFSSAQRLLKCRRLARFPYLITDMRMPAASGIELSEQLVAAGHAIPTVVITAYPDNTVRARALRAGVFCYLPSRSTRTRCSPASMRRCTNRAPIAGRQT
jgi:FixJ family two-component response regulator